METIVGGHAPPHLPIRDWDPTTAETKTSHITTHD